MQTHHALPAVTQPLHEIHESIKFKCASDHFQRAQIPSFFQVPPSSARVPHAHAGADEQHPRRNDAEFRVQSKPFEKRN